MSVWWWAKGRRLSGKRLNFFWSVVSLPGCLRTCWLGGWLRASLCVGGLLAGIIEMWYGRMIVWFTEEHWLFDCVWHNSWKLAGYIAMYGSRTVGR